MALAVPGLAALCGKVEHSVSPQRRAWAKVQAMPGDNLQRSLTLGALLESATCKVKVKPGLTVVSL